MIAADLQQMIDFVMVALIYLQASVSDDVLLVVVKC